MRLYDRLSKAGKAPHAAYLKGFCSAAGGDLLISVMQQAPSGSCDADAAEPAHGAAPAQPAQGACGRARLEHAGLCAICIRKGARKMNCSPSLCMEGKICCAQCRNLSAFPQAPRPWGPSSRLRGI